MTKPLGGALPTRRRTSSTGDGGDTPSGSSSNAATGGAATVTSADSPVAGSIAASRPKRRSRGLSSSSRTGTTPSKLNEDDSNMESSSSPQPPHPSSNHHHHEPATTAIGDGNEANSPSSTGLKRGESSTKKIPSPKSSGLLSNNSTPSPTASSSKIPLVAIDEEGKSWKLSVIVDDLPFESATMESSQPTALSRKRTRSTDMDSSPHESSTASSPPILLTTTIPSLGHDGNMFNCHVCHLVGEVVCCDGCPQVYHKTCIPVEDPSRKALDNDEDPWYCPSCYPKHHKKAKTKNRSKPAVLSTPKLQRTCSECHQIGFGLKQCESCQTWMHHPLCARDRSGGDKSKKKSDTILCSNCRQEQEQEQDQQQQQQQQDSESSSISEEEPTPKKPRLAEGAKEVVQEDSSSTVSPSVAPKPVTEDMASARRRTRSLSNASEAELVEKSSKTPEKASKKGGEDDDDNDDRDDNSIANGDKDAVAKAVLPPPPSTTKKRRRPGLPKSIESTTSSGPPLFVGSGESPPLKKSKDPDKKKKKKKKKHFDDDDNNNNNDDENSSMTPSFTYGSVGSAMPTATPAFYFFLGENRIKIERNLSRKHRTFHRLPKGLERNEIVAREGAAWWIKLRPSEIRRFMNMSMRDFEHRIIEWKEEKNIRDMLIENDIDDDVVDPSDMTPDDEMLTYENHERLYLGTTVGSKPFKPESGISHNRLLLELLQDMRFHPVPVFSATRTEEEYGQMDFSRITIPYFDVHGPVATSVGDECLGCNRGWAHHCNVLKRRVPAVEHRAKLQPPLSSLVATRVGLGLRPKPRAGTEGETEEDSKKVDVFTTREISEATAAKNLPIVPWDSLSDPSSRADDIVQFIEEAMAMKVPEPPRPGLPGRNNHETKKSSGRAALPIRGRLKRELPGATPAEEEETVVNKCGRCRTVIQTDTGCIQCRRAQLVINMSKKQGREGPVSPKSPSDEVGSPGGSSKSSLKAQTYMLGRVTMKEGSGEVQSEGDQAIANGILRQRWTPFAILPPHTLESPTPRPKRDYPHSDDESVMEDEPSDLMEQNPTIHNVPPGDDSSSSSKEPTGEAAIVKLAFDHHVNNGESSTGSSPKPSRLSSKRLRSARIGASTNPDPLDDTDRQKMAEKYKEEADELNKSCLSVACCGILLAMMRRDPLLLFAAPVTAEGYTAIIKNPIDFGKIRTNVLGGKYGTLGSFVTDARLLCTNALAYNPPGSIYWKTAKELFDVLAVMQKRASNWINAVKDAHAMAWRRGRKTRLSARDKDSYDDDSEDFFVEDPFEELRKNWPEGVDMLENSDWLRKCITADFMRTKENETVYYGSLALRRAAVAAEASLAPYPDTCSVYNTISRRSHVEDETLRRLIDDRVSEIIDPVELKDLQTWREESIMRVMRRAQSRRLEGLIGSVNGCARCDGMRVDQELKMAMTAETVRWGRTRRKNNEIARVDRSRIDLSTGLASKNAQDCIERIREESRTKKDLTEKAKAVGEVAVSVRGSRIHGWGLVADQSFKKGDMVAEYVGEYVSLAVTEAREKIYQEQRIQDYQFRLDDQLVIDATMRGGHGRYINHNCNPNCIAKMIPGTPPNEHLKRVIIMAQRDIAPREELTYDYQFPLELDLDARIPCNCHSEHCRGFMNWDLPEEGANNQVFRSQKRGANMRDRIRRLGRPLKGEK